MVLWGKQEDEQVLLGPNPRFGTITAPPHAEAEGGLGAAAAADAAGQAPPRQPPEVSDLEALFMKVRDQPCSVLEVRRADERGGGVM